MKNIFAVKECDSRETRVSITPTDAQKLIKLGWNINIETQAGSKAGFSDADYETAGAKIVAADYISQADFVTSIRKPSIEKVKSYKKGALHLSLLDPFNDKDLIKAFKEASVGAASFEMIPRSTIAQKMDVLSSQANLGGYCAVIKAANTMNRIIPMMMTPAGTISPLKFFIVGVGVAGLQAIATAKRMGARVEAFDTRPTVEDQVKSLGAKFIKIDLGEMEQTSQGYAKELTPQQLELQRKGMAKVCAQADVIITTAKLFGRKAPTIITKDMVAGMKSGSVIVDMAVESGGNVEGSVADELAITENGVKIIGDTCLEASVPATASQMYSANVYNFIEHFTDKENNFVLNMEDDILKSCIITKDGEIFDERFQ